MTRLSPAVARTVSILNFLADHPDQSFTMTEIVKTLKLSRATGHAMLAGLVETGYLFRTTDKTYVLGPALARVGAAAQASLSPLQVAAPEMRALADEFDVICSAAFLDRDEIVMRERASSVSHVGWGLAQGARTAFRPPFGSVFMAWSEQGEIDAWLARMTPPPGESEMARIQAGLDFPRRHGFAFGVRKVPIVDESHARALSSNTELTDYIMGDLDLERTYDLAFVAAPVFDARRRIAFCLSLQGFVAPRSGQAIEQIGRRLQESCTRVTAFLGGHAPELATGG
jgi:DNA-binding IclR family transcriptional regulator